MPKLLFLALSILYVYMARGGPAISAVVANIIILHIILGARDYSGSLNIHNLFSSRIPYGGVVALIHQYLLWWRKVFPFFGMGCEKVTAARTPEDKPYERNKKSNRAYNNEWK